jgi:uncharacterized protein (TIGR03437 family)
MNRPFLHGHGPSTGMDRAAAVTVEASGIYVIGNGVHKYDARGNELWARAFDNGPGFGVAADATGVYTFSIGQGSTGPQPVLRKYSAGGNDLWTRPLELYQPGNVVADASGVYVSQREGYRHYLRKYSADGSELWTRRWDAPSQGIFLTAAADTTGVYVISFGITGGGGAGTLARKFDSRGNELWSREYPNGVPIAAAAAEGAGFFVASGPGFGLSGPVLRRYDAGGNEQWTRPLAAFPQGLAAEATGVYLIGSTGARDPALPGQCRTGSGGDAFLRKYDLSGAEVWTREFGATGGAATSAVAVDLSGVYVAGTQGSGVIRAVLDVDSFPDPVGAFLAKFDKTAAVIAAAGPRLFPDCIVNAASYVGGGVAPGEIVTLFGSGMGPAELAPLRLTEDRLATALAGARILFNGVPAPLVYVSDKQSSAIVPYAVAGRTSVEVQVEYQGVQSDPVTVPVLPSRPGIFSVDASGQGQGAILNEDGTVNSPSNPARRGSVISIFGTGGGEAAPGVADGQLVGGALPRTSLPVSVFFDIGLGDDGPPAKQGEVLYAGGSPGSVAGLLQVNVRVPANATVAGDKVPFALIVGSQWTVYQATVALQ